MRFILLFLLPFSLFLAGCSSSNATAAETTAAQDTVQTVATTADTTETIKKNLTFAFVGDIMMGTTYPEEPVGAYLPERNGQTLFTDVAAILSSADIAAGNLEGTLFNGIGTVKKCKDPSICYAFRTPTDYVANLTAAGIDFVSIANNHINDFGPEGIKSTIRTLDEAGIKYAGLQRHGADTATIHKNGYAVGFAAFSPSAGTLSINDLDKMRKIVSELKKTHDIVIVSFHGGAEGASYSHVPHTTEIAFGENRGNVERFAHTAVDAGADIVYGHGPHVARGAELYKNHLILYSLGNFCTPYRVSLSGISGYAPIATVETDSEGHFIKGKIHSFLQQRGKGPIHDATGAVARQMQRLSREDFPSSPLRIAKDGTMSK